MRWIEIEEQGLGMALREWAEALRDVEDLERMTALGRKAYRGSLKAAGVAPDELEDSLAGFAHILHHMLDEMDEELWLDLRWYLEMEWQVSHAALYEAPSQAGPAALKAMPMETRLAHLGAILQARVRPMIPLLTWAMLVSDGRRAPLRAYTGLENDDSMLVAVSMLNQLIADGVPAFLDGEDAAGLWVFVRALRFNDATADEVLRATLHRAYEVHGKDAVLDLYLHSTQGTALSSAELDDWIGKACRLSAALDGFKAMLLASVTGENGPLHPEPREPRKERRRKVKRGAI
jgi:hypothetical protein